SPNLHSAIRAGRGEETALAGNRERCNGSIVSAMPGDNSPVSRVPNLNESFAGTGDQKPSIPGPYEGSGGVILSDDRSFQAAVQSPDLDEPVSAGGGEVPPVRAPDNCVNRPAVRRN